MSKTNYLGKCGFCKGIDPAIFYHTINKTYCCYKCVDRINKKHNMKIVVPASLDNTPNPIRDKYRLAVEGDIVCRDCNSSFSDRFGILRCAHMMDILLDDKKETTYTCNLAD